MMKFSLRRDESALVIVDVQERLAAVMDDREKVVANCLHLLEIARLLDMPVFLTEQYPKGLGQTVSEITRAVSGLKPIEKISFSCCGEPGFVEALSSSGRRKVVLAGMETHVCVLQTCVDLLDRGYTVHLVKDAVCSRTTGNYEAGIGFMRDSGAAVTTTETVLFQLLERAGTEEFKAISKRIK